MIRDKIEALIAEVRELERCEKVGRPDRVAYGSIADRLSQILAEDAALRASRPEPEPAADAVEVLREGA